MVVSEAECRPPTLAAYLRLRTGADKTPKRQVTSKPEVTRGLIWFGHRRNRLGSYSSSSRALLTWASSP
jgi:hypothetical protein